MSIDPIRRSVTVPAPPARAFDMFVRDIGKWWPHRFRIGSAAPSVIVIDPGIGGRWCERADDGTETQWGEVLAWQPPDRLVLAWRISPQFTFDPHLLTEVELNFRPAGKGTLVTLEHRNLERFGDSAQRMAEQVGAGWPACLAAFAAFASPKTPSQEPQ